MNSVSVATLCNLLNNSPLKHLSETNASLHDSFVTETKPEETDLDTSLCYSQEECTTELVKDKIHSIILFTSIIDIIEMTMMNFHLKTKSNT